MKGLNFITLLMVMFSIIGILGFAVAIWPLVAYKFYYWFILPVYPNLTHLTYLQILGISLFINAIKPSSPDTKTKTDAENTKYITHVILNPIIMLVIGYIIKLIFF